MDKITKLQERCEALAVLVNGVKTEYSGASQNQKAFLETVVGAAIWYLPKHTDSWTGKLSVNCLRSFHSLSNVSKPKTSEEHVLPRKIAAGRLLRLDQEVTGNLVFDSFVSEFGKFHLVLPGEIKRLQSLQRSDLFELATKTYSSAGIHFVDVSLEELRQIKKRNDSLIEEILEQNGFPLFDQSDDKA